MERVRAAGSLIGKCEPHASVKERQFTESMKDCPQVERMIPENFWVGFEVDDSSIAAASQSESSWANGDDASLKFDVVVFVCVGRLDFAPLRERRHHFQAHSVQPKQKAIGSFI